MNQTVTLAPISLYGQLNETGKQILELLNISQEQIAALTKDQIFLILSLQGPLQNPRIFLDAERNVLVQGKSKSRGKLNLKRIQKHFSEETNSVQ